MIPVAVRLSNQYVDQHITRLVSDFSYRSSVPGGFQAAKFDLHRPITRKDPLLTPFTKIYAYDRTGEVLWEGRLALPGKAAGQDGQVWSITAAGPSAHASDVKRSLIYIDRDLTSMYRNNSLPAAEVGVDIDPGNASQEEAIVFRFPNGINLNTNSNIAFTYDRIAQAQMFIGGVNYSWDAGFTNGAFEIQSVYQPGAAAVGDPADVAGGSQNVFAGASDDLTTVTFRMIRISGGAITIIGDATWSSIANLNIRGRLYTKTGTEITGAVYDDSFVLAHEIVADLLGRSMLPFYDGVNATIDTTTIEIDQLAYADPVSAEEVLADLMALEPAYYWAAWESNPLVSDQYRFEWKAWPVTPRYETSVARRLRLALADLRAIQRGPGAVEGRPRPESVWGRSAWLCRS